MDHPSTPVGARFIGRIMPRANQASGDASGEWTK